MACKYAFDPADTDCKDCDGVTMEISGKSVSCKKCPGYEKLEEDVQDTLQDVEEVKEEIIKEETENVTENVQENDKTIVKEKYVTKSEKVTLEYMSGVSVEKDSVWYKFECKETREVPVEFLEEERKALWEEVNNEVDNQVEYLFKN